MEEKLIRCHLVASVLAADGRMEETERSFLRQYMDQLGLAPDEREQIEAFEGAEAAIEAARTLPATARRSLLDDLAAAALADTKLNQLEMRLVKQLGALLQLD